MNLSGILKGGESIGKKQQITIFEADTSHQGIGPFGRLFRPKDPTPWWHDQSRKPNQRVRPLGDMADATPWRHGRCQTRQNKPDH